MNFMGAVEEFVDPVSGSTHRRGFVAFSSTTVPNPTKFLPRALSSLVQGSTAATSSVMGIGGKAVRAVMPPRDLFRKGGATSGNHDDSSRGAPADAFDLARLPRQLRLLEETPRQLEKLENVWVYGLSGSGKTRWVYDHYGPDEQIFLKSSDRYWDGFMPEVHETVLIDDLHPSWRGARMLSTWADNYPFRAETRNGTLFIRPKRIIVTSNYKPENVFNYKDDIEKINRRFVKLNMNIPLW